MGAEHRTKIANSKILKHLIEHATGEREMTSTQVTAGLGLLDRVMPKLANTDITSDGEKVEFPSEIILRAAVDPNGS